ncbi:putative fluoride ion transporter CrcB [Planctomycetales bacterium]|nr:putative fluoride ion transporter CrcB [Planctomycetales bacterium]GHT35257.1 putative fluoride ion transporter CrcB [Planctomycetales bacterium]
MNTAVQICLLAAAGALGTLARYGVSQGAVAFWGTLFPWGTFIVNISGCFLFGLVAGWLSNGTIPPYWKVILLTGFMGGFTTFSAFAFENQQLLAANRFGALTFNLLGQNMLGIAAVTAGLWCSK